jgi:phosphate transport system permease protein
MSEAATTILGSISAKRMQRRRRMRMLVDRLSARAMAIGGISVIIAILLIFFYLLYVVVPMFRPASLETIATYPAVGEDASDTLVLAVDEYAEIGLQVLRDGTARFFQLVDGRDRASMRLPLPAGIRVVSAAVGDPASRIFALGTDDGRVLVARHSYLITYPDDIRNIKPGINLPLGEKPVIIDNKGRAIIQLAVQGGDDETTIVAVLDDGTLKIVNVTVEESLLGDERTLSVRSAELPFLSEPVTHIALDVQQRELFVATIDGRLSLFNVTNKTEPELVHLEVAAHEGEAITALRYLAGGISALVGFSSGRIAQWIPVRQEDNSYLISQLREFHDQSAPITAIAPEYFRKGFAAVDGDGTVGIYHTTAHRTLLVKKVADSALTMAEFSPRADSLLLFDNENTLYVNRVHNEHPEVSWKSLWRPVHYENRQSPEYIWQSSSASSDFEPKFSLTPLTFGTLKAAFYAMLFAVPLAIFGAIYAAYFMSSSMNAVVKSSIEVMGALPTVILGFLAGLWLAPLVEARLPAVFLLLMLLPVFVLVFAYLWSRLPPAWRHVVPDGWEAMLLIPIVILAIAVSLSLSQPVENLLFAGNMPKWLTNELGIGFDQRNSLVVGIAMGFAVIPTIFSISEDAVFSVPKHLTSGSLALGATPWQTMIRVVILTASPGIFSAVMIGLGRAVGETMIVLMATGNTPIMDINIFQGFRALSANIAVEMPESEVGSTHYRILFLAALVLFVLTFMVNTIAEVVRQRLRKKYSSL